MSFIFTIILLNGSPSFVKMSSEGNDVEFIENVPDYFDSKNSHDQIVKELLIKHSKTQNVSRKS